MLSPAQRLEVVEKAGRAPSPHNIQPARWRFLDDEVELFEQTSRWLSVGDPSGGDNRVSLGMAWEGMSLALSSAGFQLGDPVLAEVRYPPSAAQRRVASAALRTGAAADPLAAFVDARRCWRGRFPAADADTLKRIDGVAGRHRAMVTVTPRDRHEILAEWYDAAAADGLRDPAFARELHHWIRFSARDPNWTRDGLATDCMALSRIEALGASVALRPGVVRVLVALRLAHLLVSEADKVRSSAAIVLLHAPPEREDFDVGREWYRFWLGLTAAGIAAVPMSALKDSPRHAQLMLKGPFGIPRGHRLVNCMRLGEAPREIPRSARLPASELLL
jgi:nitroreductase